VFAAVDGVRYQDERLWLTRCAWCGSTPLHAVAMCPTCGGEEFGWRASAGLGQIIERPARAGVAPGFARIQLDEGSLVECWIAGRPGDALSPGMRVRFCAGDMEDAPDLASGTLIFELVYGI
jgi:uncharacterized OB-fold protein